jgi:phospholipid/cholesterol/gamma-HCH transport system ATP-binding protein
VVHRLIASLAEELGITSIIVTHDIEGALGISDRVALLENGTIRFVGTPLEFRESNDPIVGGFLGRDVELESINTLETV